MSQLASQSWDAERGTERDASLLKTLLDVTTEGVIVIDAEGIVRVCNPSCERLFGLRADEMIGWSARHLVAEHCQGELDRCLASPGDGAGPPHVAIRRELVGRRHDGAAFPLELSLHSVDATGCRFGFVRDLSEREDRERRIRELQDELLQVSRLGAMGQMSSAIVHELNQPLTAITNYVKTARRILEDDAPSLDRLREMIDKAAEQTLRAGSVVRNLRAFVGKRESRRQNESLNGIIDEAIALALVDSADSGVEVSLALDPYLAPVWVDRIQVQQVLINLIRNGIEALLAEQKRTLRITTETAKSFAQVTVADSGSGLAPEIAARLFQPFVTSKEKGMGIGLTICRAIVEAHGGRIWAEPGRGTGAVFCFRLPFTTTVEGNT